MRQTDILASPPCKTRYTVEEIPWVGLPLNCQLSRKCSSEHLEVAAPAFVPEVACVKENFFTNRRTAT
jgi:hypothetical protein